jgi:hypothetical protein
VSFSPGHRGNARESGLQRRKGWITVALSFGENEHDPARLEHIENGRERVGVSRRIQSAIPAAAKRIARAPKWNNSRSPKQGSCEGILEQRGFRGERYRASQRAPNHQRIDQRVRVVAGQQNGALLGQVLQTDHFYVTIEPPERETTERAQDSVRDH